ncbi:hypothetical protein HMI54_004785 [Coelomomyces lativittatus]|nr:hypothetical protein HMI54_004785 [Coelomomyces lativittatus]KAJ1508445.1 hypothetical protein HMI55_000371 [Coelomomyces lativittatus]
MFTAVVHHCFSTFLSHTKFVNSVKYATVTLIYAFRIFKETFLFFQLFFSTLRTGCIKRFAAPLKWGLRRRLCQNGDVFLHCLNFLCTVPIPFAFFITSPSIFFTTVRGNFRTLFIVPLTFWNVVFSLFSACLLISDELSRGE